MDLRENIEMINHRKVKIAIAFTRLAVCWFSAVAYFAGHVAVKLFFLIGGIAVMTALAWNSFVLENALLDFSSFSAREGFTEAIIQVMVPALFLIAFAFDALKGFKATREELINQYELTLELYLELFGHSHKLSLPYYLESIDEPEALESRFTWKSFFSGLQWLIVLLAWIIAITFAVWLSLE